MAELPRGTVTLLFTDIEGSTRLLQELGDERYVRALEDHRRLLRGAFTELGGIEVEMQGDSFHFVFADPCAAVLAAADAQRALAEHAWESAPIRVRVGIHTGEPLVSGHLYAGLDVHRAARVMGAGHGGQVLLSETTCALIEAALTDGLSLRDLGEHRLKDLSAPQRLYQLGAEDFPPLKSLYQTNLPVPGTPFLGRERELQEVSALLADDEVRLLTLTGAGGTGKTRLAAQAAADASELYLDGVFWVGLAALRDPALVTATIAQALGTKDDLAEHIGAKRLLLLLDNFEQLLEAATELAGLLGACPGLTLLVTSRERLHLSAEREYPVLPLRELDAVSLFHERARATGTNAAGNGEVLEICRRLDRLPLAIELAAARVKLLSPQALLVRLEQRLPVLSGGARDLPERQRTLRSTISWSYELLTPAERQLFARLALFAGGCTLDAAEEVCDADLDRLQSLVDKSLLRRTNERFWMLETIREYAGEQLASPGRAGPLRQRHADYFVALAERAKEGWSGSEQRLWLDRLDAEQSNLRAALAYLESTGQTDAVLTLVGGIRYFWAMRAAWAEGRRWVEPALERTKGERSRRRAAALGAAGMFAYPLGDLDAARAFSEESVAIFRELGDPADIGRSLGGLGAKMAGLGDVTRARELFEEAAAHLRACGENFALALVVGNLADLAMRDGDHTRAQSLLEEALALHRELGSEQGVPNTLYNVAFLHFQTRRDREAVSAAAESLLICHRIGDRRYAILNLSLLGSLAAREGDSETAARLLGAAEAERARAGLALDGTPEGALHDKTVDDIRAELGNAGFESVFAEGRSIRSRKPSVTRFNEIPPLDESRDEESGGRRLESRRRGRLSFC